MKQFVAVAILVISITACSTTRYATVMTGRESALTAIRTIHISRHSFPNEHDWDIYRIALIGRLAEGGISVIEEGDADAELQVALEDRFINEGGISVGSFGNGYGVIAGSYVGKSSYTSSGIVIVDGMVAASLRHRPAGSIADAGNRLGKVIAATIHPK